MPSPRPGSTPRSFLCLATALTVTLAGLAACRRPAPAEARDPKPSAPSGVVTFNEHVAPILFANCASCHRPVDDAAPPTVTAGTPGDPVCIAGAPFSVLDYGAVQRRAASIVAAVTTRAMPPWLPEPGHGDFANPRRLTDDEIALIARWAAQGAPEGDPGARPVPPESSGGWRLGTPDLVVTFPQAYQLAAGEGDVFRTFVVPVPLTTTRYVRGVEFRADKPAVLHHANVGVDPARVARGLDRADPGPGFAVMPADAAVQNVYGWSPGKVPALESSETAWGLEPDTDLVVQLHMVGNGQAETLQPSIGFYFSDVPPTRTPMAIRLESKSIDIPAGESRYVLEDRYVLPADVDVLSVYPHAHYLASEMRGTATRPDGTTVDLLWIRRWDMRWQDQYRYRTPLFLPRGTTLAMRFVYDNSSGNPNSRQRPPQRVRWGPLSTDEMGALWLDVVPRRQEDTAVLTADYFRRAQAVEIAGAEFALAGNPASSALRNRVATLYVQAGRLAEASGHLRLALTLDPDDALAHSNLGTVLQAQGRLDEALRHLRQAVRLTPKDDRIRFNLGNGLLAAGQAGEAARALQAAVALNPENADAHFNLAMLLGPQNRLEEAIAHLRRVVEITPRNGEAYRNLSVAYGLQGRLDDAIASARTAVRLLPGSAPARDQLERLLAARR